VDLRGWSMSVALRALIRAAVTILAVALLVAAYATLGPGAARATSGKISRCEKIIVHDQHWGIYVERGEVSCATAATILRGVLAGKGREVDKGPGEAYTLYDGWLCPYDQMGVADCYYASRPVEHPRRAIFALSCSKEVGEPACPVRSEI
jgi:hypothetical protein